MEKLKKYISKQNILIFAVIIIASIIPCMYLLGSGIDKGIDTQYHMSRIIGMVNSWKSGNLLAYIHLDETGAGYAMGFFYSNLFMIIPGIIYLLTGKIVIAYKIFLYLCSLATAVSMYYTTKKITNSKYAGMISSVLYTTCAYRIITIYAKSFAGEILSFIFIPLIILGLYEILFGNEKKWWIFALGFIGILNSNLVMTEIMIAISLVTIIVNVLCLIKNKKRFFALIKSGIFSLGICAIFWMPMLEQLKNSTFQMFVEMNVYQPTKWLIEFKNIIFGTIQCNGNIAASYGLGCIFIAILIFRFLIKKRDEKIKICDICIISGFVLMIFMTKIIPYDKLGKLGGMIQFPSRFEVPISAFFSIASGIICYKLLEERNKLKYIILIGIIIWQGLASWVIYESCLEKIRDTLGVTRNIKVEDEFLYNVCDGVYLPEGANYEYARAGSLEEKQLNKDVVREYEKNGLSIKLKYEKNEETDYIEVPLFYYYGYVAQSLNDGTKYEIQKGDNGAIRILLNNKQEDEITIYYKTTLMQKIGILITTIFVLLTIIYVLGKYKISKKEKIEKDIPKYDIKEIKGKNSNYCVCIPILNEGERIKRELEKALKNNLQEKYDFILLDSGTTDDSISDDNLEKYKINTVIFMEEKQKYTQSKALKAGFDFAIKRNYDGVITIDGNNKDSIEDIEKFIDKLKYGYDYIQGSRYVKGGIEKNTPKMRNFAVKYIHAPIISIITNKKYTDTTNLFRGYSKKYLLNKNVNIFLKRFKSYELSVYLSVKADKLGLKTDEIPVARIYPDEKKYPTKIGKFKGNYLVLKSLFEGFLY